MLTCINTCYSIYFFIKKREDSITFILPIYNHVLTNKQHVSLMHSVYYIGIKNECTVGRKYTGCPKSIWTIFLKMGVASK